MAQEVKYLSYSGLSHLKDVLEGRYEKKGHTHTQYALISKSFITNRDATDNLTSDQITAYADLSTSSAGHTAFKVLNSGSYNVDRSGYSELLINLGTNTGSVSALEFLTHYIHDDRLRVRKVIDSNRVSGEFKALAWYSDIPTTLKNPNSLTIQGNGTTLTNGVYDGSTAKTVNITPASIGAAASSHNHTYLKGAGIQASATTRNLTFFPATTTLFTGGWTASGGTYATNYGTTLDISYSTWYQRLAFNTAGRIEYFRGINSDNSDKTSATLGKIGDLAYTSDIPTKVSQLTNDAGYTTATGHTHSYLPLTGGTMTGTITSQNIIPKTTNTYNLGSSSLKWANVYATTFTGNVTGNVTGSATKLGSTTISFTPAETDLTPDNIYTLVGGTTIKRGSWYYAGNGYISNDTTGVGTIDLAGTTVIQADGGSSTAYTQLYLTPATGSTTGCKTNEIFMYNNNGSGYSPSWTRVLTNRNYAEYCADKSHTHDKITIKGIDAATTHGDYMGILQSAFIDAMPSGTWYNVIKILHNNSAGYYTELAQSFTGTEGLYHRRMNNGAKSAWRHVLDSTNYTDYCAAKSHTHTKAQITDFPVVMEGKNGTNDLNANFTTSNVPYIWRLGGSNPNLPTDCSYGNLVHFTGTVSDTAFELLGAYNSDKLLFRRGTWKSDGTGSINTATWKQIAFTSDIPTSLTNTEIDDMFKDEFGITF